MSTMPPPRSWLRDPWCWALGLASCLLLLINLQSSGLLWQDEAETAVLARNVLNFGYPRVFDGLNRVNPGLMSGPGQSWAYHPWLQFYLVAASFMLFGTTTVAARLPFAVLGVVTVLLAYRLALRLVQHQLVARLTSILTLLSVPLILHSRQCRYYSLATVATLWVIYAYVRAREGNRRAWWSLAVALVVLFNSHHGAFVPMIAALLLDLWRQGIPRSDRPIALVSAAVVATFTLPWFFVLNLMQHSGAFSLREIAHHIQFYVRQVNRYLFPAGFLLLVWLLRGIRPVASWSSASAAQRASLRIVFLVLACNLAFIATIPWQRHFRYVIHLAPLLYFVQAICLWVWLKHRRLLLAAITFLLVATDLLHYSAPYVIVQAIPRFRHTVARAHGLVTPESLLAKYAYELTHEYRGPVEGIVEQLRRDARPGESLKTPYDDHGVIFYTNLKVEDLNRFTAPTYPDWIIPRRDWIVTSEFFASPYFKEIDKTYDRIVTDAPDLAWENRPDPGSHHFWTAQWAPPVVLYHKRAAPR